MPRAVEIMRFEANVDEFLRRPRSAHRRFTCVSLCYLQHTEKVSRNSQALHQQEPIANAINPKLQVTSIEHM